MAWRVSCAALWATVICDRPTVNTSVAPMNKQASPALMRWETESDMVLAVVVMDTLRATGLSWGGTAPAMPGRSPDSRVRGCVRAFPVSQWPMLHETSPLTVAGAVTDLAPIGSSTPCSLFGLLPSGFEAPSPVFVTADNPPVNPLATMDWAESDAWRRKRSFNPILP